MTGAEEDELQRLRRSLYRPDPPPGALERVEALLAARAAAAPPSAPQPVAGAAGVGPDPLAVADTVPVVRPARRRTAVVVTATAALVAVGTALVALQPPVPRGSASALVPALQPDDARRLDRALDGETAPWGPTGAGATLVDVVQAADLEQLRVWRGREASAWVQRGTGPFHRDLDGTGRAGRSSTDPLSIVVRCDRDAAYRWAVHGTSPGSDVVHVLASGDADHCDQATVASGRLPAGSRITAFDLRTGGPVEWTMAIVTPA